MAGKPFRECPQCGVPNIDGLHTLVLYFQTAEDAKEFGEVMKEAVGPRMSSYAVASGKCDKGVEQ